MAFSNLRSGHDGQNMPRRPTSSGLRLPHARRERRRRGEVRRPAATPLMMAAGDDSASHGRRSSSGSTGLVCLSASMQEQATASKLHALGRTGNA
jgi:hypothetical protein